MAMQGRAVQKSKSRAFRGQGAALDAPVRGRPASELCQDCQNDLPGPAWLVPHEAPESSGTPSIVPSWLGTRRSQRTIQPVLGLRKILGFCDIVFDPSKLPRSI
jgi:hypothetical protein